MRGNTAILVAFALAGCTLSTPPVIPVPVSTGSIPNPTPSVRLANPGVAKRIVNKIVAEHPTYAVVKVDISRSNVEVSFLTPTHQIEAYEWKSGKIKRVDSDVVDIAQASFNPQEFKFDDIEQIFAEAQRRGASSSRCQLQIVEANPGEILMSVTTRPESVTVFFRKDGTPINNLDYHTVAGIREGLKDALGQSTQAYAVGFQEHLGLWVDTIADPNLISRRTRPARLPTYTATRRGSKQWPTFLPTEVSSEKIIATMIKIRTKYKLSDDQKINFVIDGHLKRSRPTITYDFPGGQMITDLSGTNITAWTS